MDCGFLIVASRDIAFAHAAARCALSIKDELPNAKVCVATHEEWKTLIEADEFISPIPDHVRAKLWCLPKSPFERTLYVDADMFCVHSDAGKIFDLEPDAPLLMTENRPYNSKVVYFDKDRSYGNRQGRELHAAGKAERLRWHCGFFRYDLPKTKELMEAWLSKLDENHNGKSPWPKDLLWWDTFAFWRALSEHEFDFQPTRFPEPDGRWQHISGYRDEELGGQEPVFTHYTIPASHRKRRGDGDFGELK